MSSIYEELEEYYKTSTGGVYKIPIDEQESWINIDYEMRHIQVFTNRPVCLKRLISILGEPVDTNIFGGSWYIDFDDRKTINKVFSMNLYLPRKNKNE